MVNIHVTQSRGSTNSYFLVFIYETFQTLLAFGKYCYWRIFLVHYWQNRSSKALLNFCCVMNKAVSYPVAMERDLHVDLSLKSLSNIFNRLNESVISAINSCYDIDIINNRFQSLRQHWLIVLARYEKELESVSEFDEQWIGNIQEYFERTEILKHQYDKSRLSVKSSHDNKLNLEINLCKQNESRSIETQLLEEYKEILGKMVLEYDGLDSSKRVIIGVYHEYKQQLRSLQKAHVEYMYTLRSSTNNDDIVMEGESWLDDVLCGVRKIHEKVWEIIYGGSEPESRSNIKCGLKLEKMRLPSFNGNIRDYPKFRSDFDNYVMPKLEPKDIPFVLKSCFIGQAYETIKNVEDDVDVIWQRIDEKYGRPSKVVDEVLFDILRFPTLLDKDKGGFIKFVSVIEEATVDLKRIHLENEIANCNVISEIEKRLPPIIRRDWSYEVVTNNNTKDNVETFASLLRFLKEQRDGLEYLTSKVRYSPDEIDGIVKSENSAHIGRCGHIAIDNGYENDRLYKCGIHNTNGHSLGDCKSFKVANSSERIQIAMKSRACWNCLMPGHKARNCLKSKNCSLKGCKMWHHELLHEAHLAGQKFGRQ